MKYEELKAKATPEPWTVHSFDPSGDVTQAGLYEIEEANEEVNNLVAEGGDWEEVARANRLLIGHQRKTYDALLKSLKEMRDIYEAIPTEVRGQVIARIVMNQKNAGFLDRVRAAIKAAEEVTS